MSIARPPGAAIQEEVPTMSMFTSETRSSTRTVGEEPTTADARSGAVVGEGVRRGWYRLLFDLGPVTVVEFAIAAGIERDTAAGWIDEQLEAGVLRVVGIDEHDDEMVLLPGEHVTALLGDHGGPELSGARVMAERHVDRMAPVVRALADIGPRGIGAFPRVAAG
ncbi:hypothetical protein ASG80_10835 [Agromyces sp. Soil535]|nr:hypothetical protein ASG80_10835 [Agromyces sp. Soil535]